MQIKEPREVAMFPFNNDPELIRAQETIDAFELPQFVCVAISIIIVAIVYGVINHLGPLYQ
jgi:hypothetical protein